MGTRWVRGDPMTAHMVLCMAPIATAVQLLAFHVMYSFDLLSYRQEVAR